MTRVEAHDKVTGAARYAYEYSADTVTYAAAVTSTIACGEIEAVHADEVRAMPGVIAVLSCENAPRLKQDERDGELNVFQSRKVSYRGQLVAAVIAETSETAREAARLLRVTYRDERLPEIELRAPDETEDEKPHGDPVEMGDPDAAFAVAPVRLDVTYRTPPEHNNPMEPHATLAYWEGDNQLTVYDSNQGPSRVQSTLARLLGLDRPNVRVISPHVGGGFGSKGTPRPNVVLAAMAARVVGRPVRFAVTRRQMFAITGYRTPTIQRIRLGADQEGRLTVLAHESNEQTSTLRDFAEEATNPSRVMYQAANRRIAGRLARLDVPSTSWMRAPGEAPGMYALECAMDELARTLGIDPIELRIRNEPENDPTTGQPFSSRNLLACLREGAVRFGWGADMPPYTGLGVAASTYPVFRMASKASAQRHGGGKYSVRIAAIDIGTGARTALTRIAAETLGVEPSAVRLDLGDSALPTAPLAGGSKGTASWGTAVVRACEKLLADPGAHEALADTADEVENAPDYSRHAFGAHFAEVSVDPATGEVRVPRLLGMYAVGRVVDPVLARSQFIGGMTMGIGMALTEHTVLDRDGGFVNTDLAQYHVPACADVPSIEAFWLDEQDLNLNPMGTKGIGEIGIVGTAAAIANAVHDATGVRYRDLPLTPQTILPRLTPQPA
ncbi:xanthine dehydrogenase family protein molybdopterin-binding subunit [Actinomadura rupiterrae]|uniref:xanthine dehydrogenase family protein molybdopterin-binding subunit n=1 Tax=Actinomadura rupiterrae TaxID=559627 RepID=UPI0020A2DF20|nr:xanthine dehydrogenase family protein molybdopterin-binding subunit [Actinomadura rupiterrae]MCP2334695.1 xanthine dehydrogenase YagR molybdenum-binding subunit [Actinomadura rupiterrae]